MMAAFDDDLSREAQMARLIASSAEYRAQRDRARKPNGAAPKRDALDDEAELDRLAALSPLDYDRERKVEAERLGVQVSTLDAEVKRRRKGTGDEGGSDDLPDPEPWPHPVDGARLLDEIAHAVRQHCVVPSGAADAIALWVLHAHALDAAAISPVLAVTSPTPECGKTTLLTFLGAVVPRALPASNITAAALFRAVEKWCPTLLVDEADTFLAQNDELRGVLNSGHHRAQAFVVRTVGDDHDPRRFRTWSAKAIALIGKLPATHDSRSIHIELRRIGEGEHVEPLRGDRLGHLEPLCRKAWRWANDHLRVLREHDPEMPAHLRGRAADNWRALVAIADVAEGDWPQRARRASELLTAGRSERTAGVMLLEDIRRMFDERGADRISSKELVAALAELDDRPWPEWRRGQPITERGLAQLLEPFKIGPRKVRFGATASKGYMLDWFADAFRRYIPADKGGTREQTNNFNDLEQNEGGTAERRVPPFSPDNPLENNDCSLVPRSEPEPWEAEL